MDPSIYDALRGLFQPQPIDIDERQRQADASHRAYGPRLEREAAARRGQSDNRVLNFFHDVIPGQPTKKEAVTDILDWFTPVGDVAHGEDTYQAAKAGNYGEASLLAAMALPALLPGGRALKGLWHGSPTRGIRRFDSRFIGTGEGNDMYGRGLYFAENPKVAQQYRRDLAGYELRIGDEMYTDADIPRAIDAVVAEYTGGGRADPLHKMLRDAIGGTRVASRYGDDVALSVTDTLDDQFNNWLAYAQSKNYDTPIILGHRAEYERARKVLQDLDNPMMQRGGAIYKVDIDAKDTDFLPLDGTVADMSPRHREALTAVMRGRYRDRPPVLIAPDGSRQFKGAQETEASWKQYLDEAERMQLGTREPHWKAIMDQSSPYEMATGRHWLGGVNSDTTTKQAAEDLAKQGIPGLRYFDGLSRSTDGGTRNFVVFDDSLIKIVKMYGIPAAVGAGIITQADAERMEKEGLI